MTCAFPHPNPSHRGRRALHPSPAGITSDLPACGLSRLASSFIRGTEGEGKAAERTSRHVFWMAQSHFLIHFSLPTLIVFHDDPIWQCSQRVPKAPSCLSSLSWQLMQLAANTTFLTTGVLWHSEHLMSLCFPSSLKWVLSWSKSQSFQSRVL